jgi:tetratricopeptide (TPR) repeat protein/SAM-dependent methyltransferase
MVDQASEPSQPAAELQATIPALTRQARRLYQAGDLAACEATLRAVLDIDPGHAQTLQHLGIIAQQGGRADDALALFARAVAADDRDPIVHFNFGCLLEQAGRLEEGAYHFGEAARLSPAYAEAHLNLGNMRARQARHDEALECFERALAARPAYAEAHNNLGRALERAGQAEAAIGHYRRALAERPHYRAARLNLAACVLRQGDGVAALDLVVPALLEQETQEAKAIFCQSIADIPDIRDTPEVRGLLGRALSEPWGRPRTLADVAIRLLKRDGAVASCLARGLATWPRRFLFSSADLAALAGDPLLGTLLTSTPVCDVELERLLTLARLAMLEAATAGGIDDIVLEFCCALAQQCWINEYLFDATEPELESARALCEDVDAALASGTPVPAQRLALRACYFPLGDARLLDTPWPAPVRAILVQQLAEPREERELARSLPRLTSIEDATSVQVRQQYEENPYPRWIRAAPVTAAPARDWLARTCPGATPPPFAVRETVDILIAGCGTGQHAIETARGVSGANVLGVDLSLGSLAYAARKARELGLVNLAFAQADLLHLASAGRSFDIIEASGVLHHLAQPMAGWRELVSILRPGGWMRVGLYSERARRGVLAGRSFVAQGGYGSSRAEIRRCRQDILASGDPDLAGLARFRDFFATSECRDLIFHVQEHRFDLPKVRACLDELGLTFAGFILDAPVLERFAARFPGGRPDDLALWHVFEGEHPATFSAMYQFWVQKAEHVAVGLRQSQ